VEVDTHGDLALLRGQELRAQAAAHRLVREARALSRHPRRPSPLRTAVGTGLVRSGLRLAGEPMVPGPGVALRGPCR
jgi:hypothetical protein